MRIAYPRRVPFRFPEIRVVTINACWCFNKHDTTAAVLSHAYTHTCASGSVFFLACDRPTVPGTFIFLFLWPCTLYAYALEPNKETQLLFEYQYVTTRTHVYFNVNVLISVLFYNAFGTNENGNVDRQLHACY